VDNDFRKAMDSASTAASAGNYSNALAAYQGAVKIKDDPQARAGVAAMQQKIQEAINRALKEQQTAKQFQEALDQAKQAEQAGDYAAALGGYKSAQTVRPEDPQVAGKIKALTKQMDERKRADEARRQQQNAEAEQFDKALASGKRAEQAGNLTNALAAYQTAQRIRPADTNVAARIQAITPKVEQQARLGAGKAKEGKLQTLDSELEVLMVRFGRLKPESAKTERARKESANKGQLTLEGQDWYNNKVKELEEEYKTGGWLDQDQRAEKLNLLKGDIGPN
jgi:Flp pilus assembly protein TadD